MPVLWILLDPDSEETKMRANPTSRFCVFSSFGSRPPKNSFAPAEEDNICRVVKLAGNTPRAMAEIRTPLPRH